jgi:hypothetical protein
MNDVLTKSENADTQIYIQGRSCGDTQKKAAIYKARREAWNRLFPQGPQEEPTLPAPCSWTCSLQNCEIMSVV